MVTETEQDSVKVIAIKLPFDLQERLLSFPFLHLIREKYPKANIHFITPKKQIEVLNLLPFTAYYHEFDEDEINSIFDVHRYTSTAKIYNVDLFISLTNSFADACLGIGLRAKIRVGFSDNWKTLVLTHKTPRLTGHHITEDYFSLYRTLVGNVDPKIRAMSREVKPVVAEWDSLPYIAINLSPIRRAAIEDEMAELINFFENQRIVLFSSDDQDQVQHLIEPFMARLNKKNIYINFVYKSWIDLSKMLAYSRGVITFNGPVATFAAYMGTRTFVLYDSEDPQRSGPLYFLADVKMLNVNDPTLAHNVTSEGSIQDRKKFNMNEVFGRAFEFFKMVIS